MYMNWNKILLYAGIIEVIVGIFVFLFVSSLVGIIILLVGLFDLGIVFFWPSLLGGTRSDNNDE
jgi:hypothetical protein